MLLTTIELITPAFVDAKEGCVYFQGAAAGMIGAFDFKAVAIVDAAGDVEDQGVVKEVGGGEAKAVVAVGLGEVGFVFVISCMVHVVISF